MSKTVRVPWNKGLTGVYSKETLQKMSASICRALQDPQVRKRASESHMGKTPWNKGLTGVYSKETLQNMSASVRRALQDPQVRKRASESRKGRTPWNKGKKWKKHARNNLA